MYWVPCEKYRETKVADSMDVKESNEKNRKL